VVDLLQNLKLIFKQGPTVGLLSLRKHKGAGDGLESETFLLKGLLRYQSHGAILAVAEFLPNVIRLGNVLQYIWDR
jgi:hypothetical protein